MKQAKATSTAGSKSVSKIGIGKWPGVMACYGQHVSVFSSFSFLLPLERPMDYQNIERAPKCAA